MQINLPADIEESIERRLAMGQFTSPEEVIRAAIDQLDQYEAGVADIRESLADEAAGRLHRVREIAERLRGR